MEIENYFLIIKQIRIQICKYTDPDREPIRTPMDLKFESKSIKNQTDWQECLVGAGGAVVAPAHAQLPHHNAAVGGGVV